MKQAVPCPAIYDDMELEKGMIVKGIYPGTPMDLPHLGQACMWYNKQTREGGMGRVHSLDREKHIYEMEVLCIFENI